MIRHKDKVCLLILAIVSVFIFTQCAKSQENNVGFRATRNTPAIQGTAVGELQPLKPSSDDLKTRLSNHPAPRIWLVFPVLNSGNPSAETNVSETVTNKVELPIESIEIILSLWQIALMSRYNLDVAGVENADNYRQEMNKISNASEKASRQLKKIEIDAPAGKRTISDDEASEIIGFINASAEDMILPFKKT